MARGRLLLGGLLVLVTLLSAACAKTGPEPVGSPVEPPSVVSPAPAPGPGAVPTEPRLLLALEPGPDPEQPGWSPSRVGGVAERGPLGLAVDGERIYLADQAKGRVLRYEGGRLAGTIPAPWLDEWSAGIRLTPGGMVLSGINRAYEIDLEGRLLGLLPHTGAEPEGRGLLLPELQGEVVTLYSSPEGGRYALTWHWTEHRSRVYEMAPATAARAEPGPAPQVAPPVLLGRPVPSAIRLTSPDWAPVEVTREVDRWNLWRLLEAAVLEEGPPTQSRSWGRLQASFPGGESVEIELYDEVFLVGGQRYRLLAGDALERLLSALRFDPALLARAVAEAKAVRVAVADLPGVERSLTAVEKGMLQISLGNSYPVHPATPPQPLDPPFPRYVLHLEGEGWRFTLTLRGDRYLSAEYRGAAAHAGPLAQLVREWLPVPFLAKEEVGYLYLADRLEIEGAQDISRWKQRVVRYLLQVDRLHGSLTFKEPFTLVFVVDGERLEVAVDTEGFTYAGKRYAVPGLTDMVQLQGVP